MIHFIDQRNLFGFVVVFEAPNVLRDFFLGPPTGLETSRVETNLNLPSDLPTARVDGAVDFLLGKFSLSSSVDLRTGPNN